MAEAPALELVGVSAHYGTALALSDVSLKAHAGAVTGVLGRNGAGKTTLLRSVMRLGPRVKGQVLLFGSSTSGKKGDAIAREGVGYMPQGIRVFPQLSVRENCLAASHAAKAPRALEEALEILPELRPQLDQQAGTLSGGQQQMVGVARSIVMNCKLLLMDEPTEGLMPSLVERMREVCRQLAEEGVAVVLVEQNVKLAFNACDYLLVMEKGELRARGTADSLEASGVLEKHLGLSVE